MNKIKTIIFYGFIIVTAIVSLLYYLNPVSFLQTSYQNALTLKNAMMDHTLNCPNYLKKEGTEIMLYDLNKPVSSTNPIIFTSLDEYHKYTENKMKEGINCPILELEVDNEEDEKEMIQDNLESDTIFNKDDYDTIDKTDVNGINFTN